MRFLVRDFATHCPVTLQSYATIWEAHAVMCRLHVRHIPVTRDGSVVGIVGHHGLALAVATSTGATNESLHSIVEPVLVVRADTPLAIVAKRMADEKHPAILVDEGGKLSIFTTIDAARALEQLATKAESATRSNTTPPPSRPSHAPMAN